MSTRFSVFAFLIAAVLCLALSHPAFGQRPSIIGYEDGVLEFESATVSNFFSLEFSTNLDGPWTNWASVSDHSITGAVLDVPTPLFFRVCESDGQTSPRYPTESCLYSVWNKDLGSATSGTTNWSTAPYPLPLTIYVPPHTEQLACKFALLISNYGDAGTVTLGSRIQVGDTTSAVFTQTYASAYSGAGAGLYTNSPEILLQAPPDGWTTLKVEVRKDSASTSLSQWGVFLAGLSLYTQNNE